LKYSALASLQSVGEVWRKGQVKKKAFVVLIRTVEGVLKKQLAVIVMID
jgi:hypothetical protein